MTGSGSGVAGRVLDLALLAGDQDRGGRIPAATRALTTTVQRLRLTAKAAKKRRGGRHHAETRERQVDRQARDRNRRQGRRSQSGDRER